MKLSTNPIAMLRAIEQLQARVDALEVAKLEKRFVEGRWERAPNPPPPHKKVAPKRVKKRSEV